MGIALDVVAALTNLCEPQLLVNDNAYTIIQCSPTFYVHLVSLTTNLQPQDLLNLQEKYAREEKLLVHLWEDIWVFNPTGVLSRVKSFLGLNQTLHARKAKLIPVDKADAVLFFNRYHLQGFVNAKYHFGLTMNNELISLASFSDLRPMKSKGNQYTSAELIRFASIDGFTITGGLSKLIKHFLNLTKPNDLMTYADRDWSLGKGYAALGFELTTPTAPADLFVDQKTGLRYFPHRLPKRLLSSLDAQKELNLDDHGFAKVFNTGNLKYHLYV